MNKWSILGLAIVLVMALAMGVLLVNKGGVKSQKNDNTLVEVSSDSGKVKTNNTKESASDLSGDLGDLDKEYQDMETEFGELKSGASGL